MLKLEVKVQSRAWAVLILVASIILVLIGLYILFAPAGDAGHGGYDDPLAWLAGLMLLH